MRSGSRVGLAGECEYSPACLVARVHEPPHPRGCVNRLACVDQVTVCDRGRGRRQLVTWHKHIDFYGAALAAVPEFLAGLSQVTVKTSGLKLDTC